MVSNEVKLQKELDYIKNPRIKKSAEVLINLLPDYFFFEAASSTGKYHPSFSQGEGGLLRHTKVAVRIARELLTTKTIGEFYTSDEKDLIYLALILHDGIKRGDNEEHTRFDHPVLAANLVRGNKDKLSLTNEEIDLLSGMIETHMGEWVNDYNGNKILEEPKSKYQRFVHLCDYLSCKKFLDVKFDDKNDILY